MKRNRKRFIFVVFVMCAICLVCPAGMGAEEIAEGTEIWEAVDPDTGDWQEDEEYGEDFWQPEEDVDTGYYQYEDREFFVGDKGSFSVPGTVTDNLGVNKVVASAVFTQEDGWDEMPVLTLDEQGNYEAVSVGTVTVTEELYDADGIRLLTIVYHVTVKIDMSQVTMDKTSETKYMLRGSYYVPEFSFQLQEGEKPLPDNPESYQLVYESSNPDIGVYCEMQEGHTIVIYPDSAGKTTVTLTVNEKTFRINIKVVEVSMKKNSLLLCTKQKSQLKTTGIKKGIQWSSTNAKVVKVSSNGKVTAKKNGNAVIKAKIGDLTMGCAISVVSPKRQKTIRRAVKIGQTCTYSQANRMQQGYYDCSSLVWRSYKLSGITLGNANYAPVAADQGKWCVKNKKTVKGGLSEKNIQGMKIHAGDLMFETSESKNGRFRGIYHVEMISGYICYGFDSKGKPVLGIAWANRPADYYWHGGQLVGRP